MLDQYGGNGRIKKLEKQLKELQKNKDNCSCCGFEDVEININAVNPQGQNLALRPAPSDWKAGTPARLKNDENATQLYNESEQVPILGIHAGQTALIFENTTYLGSAGKIPNIVYKKKVACVTSI